MSETDDIPPVAAEATLLLRRLAEGDAGAADELLPMLQEELRAAAARAMRGERRDHTLQTTALVHEAWLRLGAAPGAPSFESRRHFLSVAARAMRHVLVDHARARRASKRGGDAKKVPLDEALAVFEEGRFELVALDEALDRLANESERHARVVELRFFGGLTLAETGEALDLSVDQVHYAWEHARAWLFRELTRGTT